MPQIDPGSLPALVEQLERQRNSRVLVLAASHLDTEMLPALYDQLQAIGPCPRLDVLLHGRGGVVNAARRIALLLRHHADQLAFIVPFHCASAATLLTLCADEIVAGELAHFSPFDPQLAGADDSSFSGLDIEQFGDMAAQWFGHESHEARQQSLALMCNSVFPPSLTAFYRSTREVATIGEELLAWQLPYHPVTERQRIVKQLMSGYHSHNYALTGSEMEVIGLRVKRQHATEQIAWQISKVVQANLGGAMRMAEEAPWIDAMLATRDGVNLRRKHPGGLAPRWSA
ncbi:MAG: hypothetical protein V4633_16455 [Pseudomonadota bacterium]